MFEYSRCAMQTTRIRKRQWKVKRKSGRTTTTRLQSATTSTRKGSESGKCESVTTCDLVGFIAMFVANQTQAPGWIRTRSSCLPGGNALRHYSVSPYNVGFVFYHLVSSKSINRHVLRTKASMSMHTAHLATKGSNGANVWRNYSEEIGSSLARAESRTSPWLLPWCFGSNLHRPLLLAEFFHLLTHLRWPHNKQTTESWTITAWTNLVELFWFVRRIKIGVNEPLGKRQLIYLCSLQRSERSADSPVLLRGCGFGQIPRSWIENHYIISRTKLDTDDPASALKAARFHSVMSYITAYGHPLVKLKERP